MLGNIGSHLKFFLIPTALFVLVGLVYYFTFGHAAGHLQFNAWHGPVGDVLFPYLTYLGDGWIFAVVLLPTLILDRGKFFALLILALLTLFTTAGLKEAFKEVPRPTKYFEDKEPQLPTVEGVHLHHFRSFPSGHTTTAFAALGFLAFLFPRRNSQLLCFLGAGLAGFSRIYLQQHFVRDVVAGALLGSILLILALLLMQYWSGKRKSKSFIPGARSK